jgi:hypothetical protein
MRSKKGVFHIISLSEKKVCQPLGGGAFLFPLIDVIG